MSSDVNSRLDEAYESLNEVLEERRGIDDNVRDELERTRDAIDDLKDNIGELEGRNTEYEQRLYDLIRDFEDAERYEAESWNEAHNDIREIRRELESMGYEEGDNNDRRQFLGGLAAVFAGGAIADYLNVLPEDKNCGGGLRLREQPSGDLDTGGYWPGAEQESCSGSQGATNGAGDPQQNIELDRPLDLSEYEMVVTNNDLIGEIGDEYRSFSDELGNLGSELRDAYQDSTYEDLTLGYDDNTQHVQMTNFADELLVNFGFSDQNSYEEAKRQARGVS